MPEEEKQLILTAEEAGLVSKLVKIAFAGGMIRDEESCLKISEIRKKADAVCPPTVK